MAAVRVVAPTSRFGRTVAALLVSTMLAGCAQQGGMMGMGGRETSGTEIGAVVGGAAGLLLGSGKGKIVAMLIGTAAGALIGNRIGAMLDDRDQQALAEQSRMALMARADNSQVNWASTHSGATATVVPVNTRVEQRSIKVARDARVQPTQNLDAIGADYTVTGQTNVHSAPGTDADVVAQLNSGTNVYAVGRVHGQPWVAVAQHGVTIGYVAASNVKPIPPKAKQVQTASGGFDLDAAAPVRAPEDLDAIAEKTPNVKVDTVVASVTCRDLKTTATMNGQSQSSTETACRGPDGSWDIE